MTNEITLKINDTEYTFEASGDGYFCLNEVWCYRQCKNDPLTAIEN